MHQTVLRLLSVAAVCLATATAALAQKYPDHPIRLIVPFPAGGSMDTVARTVGPRLAQHLGQSIVIENRVGADSLIGTTAVAKATPDGYTLLFQGPTMLINRAMQPEQWFDPVRELAWIAPAASTPLFLIASPKLGASTYKEFVAMAKASTRQLDYASASSTTMLADKLMGAAGGYDTMFVPFKGSSLALTAVIAGEASYSIDTLMSIKPFVDSGRIKVLATTSATRSPALPDVPSAAEQGLTGFEFISWWGMMGPAGLPADIVASLHAAMQKVLAEPEVRTRLEGLGATPMTLAPAAFAAFGKAESTRYNDIVKAKNLQIK